MVKSVREFAEKRGARVVTICGQLEAELSTLPESERVDFLKEMGLMESGLVRLTREAYTRYWTSSPSSRPEKSNHEPGRFRRV
jgi:Predicted GTPase, probable translation factor